MSFWITACQLDDLIPGTGVCALIENTQVTIFRPDQSEQLFAINNMDPFSKSNVSYLAGLFRRSHLWA